MYLLGHVAFSLLVLVLYEKTTDSEFNLRHRILIATGSMLPDFLDKPIGAVFLQTGRWIGHSILFHLIVLLILVLISKFMSTYDSFTSDVWILYAGASLHLIGDMPSIELNILLFPFLGPIEKGATSDFLYGFTHPFTVITEMLGFLVILLLYKQEHWEQRIGKYMIAILILYLATYNLAYYIFVIWM